MRLCASIFARYRSRFSVVLMAIVVAITSPLHAYEVSPMRIFMQPARGQNAATININNIRPEELLVEIKVFRRIIDADGNQTFEPADDDFLVFPPQMTIASGRSQAVRFQYLGSVGSQSEAFVVQVTEVPVNKLEASGIQFTYNFGVAVYIQPNNPRAQLEFGDGVISDGVLRFSVVNRGNDYGFIIGQGLEYRVGDQRVTIDGDTFGELVDNPIFSPNSARTVAIPLEGVADSERVTVRLSSAGN